MNNNENNKITHGLLLEDFKQNILNIISQHALDIQSKAMVLDYVNIQIQNISKQQTQKEFEEYNQCQKTMSEQKIEANDNNEIETKSV